MMNKNYVLYCHVNKLNGKKYFGITRNTPARRWDCGRGYKGTPHFYSAIQKYGWDAFQHKILASDLSEEEACILEQQCIKDFNTTDRRYGYNILQGGNTSSLTDEIKKQIGEKNKTHGESKTKIHQAWTTMRCKHKGDYVSEWDDYNSFKEWSITHGFANDLSFNRIDKTKPYSPQNCIWSKPNAYCRRRNIVIDGVLHSVNEWSEISGVKSNVIMQRLKRGWSESEAVFTPAKSIQRRNKPVKCIETGEIFKNAIKASMAKNVTQGNIYLACKGLRNSAGGLHWKYAEEI